MRRLALLLLLGGCAVPLRGVWESRPLPEIDDRFFPNGSPWRGGDAIYSVPLSNDRTLWLFGDSFIAKPGVSGREGSKMVRNSLAIETVGGGLDFFWRTEDGQPADAVKCPVAGEWFWPLSGLRIGPRLHLFLYRLKAKGDGAFGFAETATLLATVADPDLPPERWTMTTREIPASFGTASLRLEGYAYLYGIRDHRASRQAILARVPEEAIEDTARWRYWTGSGWSEAPAAAAPVFSGAATEMSVSYLPAARAFAAVTSAPLLSPDIHVLRAPRPEGPWGPPDVVYTCPEARWKKGYFCYAAKAHPELDRTGSALVISYACNSMSFPDAVRDLRIYRPRFLIATLH